MNKRHEETSCRETRKDFVVYVTLQVSIAASSAVLQHTPLPRA